MKTFKICQLRLQVAKSYFNFKNNRINFNGMDSESIQMQWDCENETLVEPYQDFITSQYKTVYKCNCDDGSFKV